MWFEQNGQDKIPMRIKPFRKGSLPCKSFYERVILPVKMNWVEPGEIYFKKVFFVAVTIIPNLHFKPMIGAILSEIDEVIMKWLKGLSGNSLDS